MTGPTASVPTRGAARATAHLAMLAGLVRAYAPVPEIRSVAVVGNAPLPPSAERARAIDACDLVIRVNGFRLDDADASAVGRRADVVVFNRAVRATPWVFAGYRQRLYLLAEPGRMHWEQEELPAWWPADLGQVPISNRGVVLPLSDALGIDSRTHPIWATTGTLAVWIARSVFPDAQLRLAGFSFVDAPGQTAWKHAYGDASPVGGEHVIEREGALLGAWLHEGRAVLHD